MATSISQFLICLVDVTIFVFLWRARNEHFAQIGTCWSYILAGSACLSSGEITNLVLLSLVQQGRVSAATTKAIDVGGDTVIILGLLIVAIGVYRWLSAVQELSIESAIVKERNIGLRERVCRDGMLLSTIPAALYHTSGLLSAKNSDIVFVNNKIEELLGYSRADFEADPTLFASLMHDEDKKTFEIERNEMWQQDNIVIEHRFRHRNGEYRWLRRHLHRLSSDDENLTEWHGCIFDITDLKQAEARLINFLEAAPNPVVTVNDKGEIILVNAQAERLFGYSSAELLGQYAHLLMPKNQSIRYADKFAAYLKAQTSCEIVIGAELYGRRKDGSKFPVEISVSPIENGNERLLAFAIRDISARKDVEAQLRQSQKMEAVGQLTGGIAHDFNNMLTIVIGNLQLVEQASMKDEAVGRFTRAALDASMRAAELIRRLLAFSRRQLLAPKSTSINELVTGIEPLLHRTVTEDITLQTRLADDLWLARIDPSQLENTLFNLIINARDALQSGGTLTLETKNVVLDEIYAAQHRDVTAGEYVMVAVSDNGKGIPKDVLPHVYEPFFSTKKEGKGSGLGLSMVYGFVKQSKGHIKIYSEEGYGTTIKIYIPRSKSTAEESVNHTVNNNAIPGGDETILLVEDDEAVREIGIYLLTSFGYKVLDAESGSDALTLLGKQEDIDLLFTDIVMPGGMTGAELAQHALGKKPSLKILYTSGYTDTAVFKNGVLERNSDVLNKPYRIENLAQSVRDVLDRE